MKRGSNRLKIFMGVLLLILGVFAVIGLVDFVIEGQAINSEIKYSTCTGNSYGEIDVNTREAVIQMYYNGMKNYNSVSDSCVGSEKVLKQYCLADRIEDSSKIIDSVVIECPSGSECIKGACVA